MFREGSYEAMILRIKRVAKTAIRRHEYVRKGCPRVGSESMNIRLVIKEKKNCKTAAVEGS
jgi:hypothetical protein